MPCTGTAAFNNFCGKAARRLAQHRAECQAECLLNSWLNARLLGRMSTCPAARLHLCHLDLAVFGVGGGELLPKSGSERGTPQVESCPRFGKREQRLMFRSGPVDSHVAVDLELRQCRTPALSGVPSPPREAWLAGCPGDASELRVRAACDRKAEVRDLHDLGAGWGPSLQPTLPTRLAASPACQHPPRTPCAHSTCPLRPPLRCKSATRARPTSKRRLDCGGWCQAFHGFLALAESVSPVTRTFTREEDDTWKRDRDREGVS